jgi:hypothetical protein
MREHAFVRKARVRLSPASTPSSASVPSQLRLSVPGCCRVADRHLSSCASARGRDYAEAAWRPWNGQRKMSHGRYYSRTTLKLHQHIVSGRQATTRAWQCSRDRGRQAHRSIGRGARCGGHVVPHLHPSPVKILRRTDRRRLEVRVVSFHLPVASW